MAGRTGAQKRELYKYLQNAKYARPTERYFIKLKC